MWLVVLEEAIISNFHVISYKRKVTVLFFAVGPYLRKWIVGTQRKWAVHPGRDAGVHDR